MSVTFKEGLTNEADDIRFRFRTKDLAGTLIRTSHDRSQDRLEMNLEDGKVKVTLQISTNTRTISVGQGLNDDVYHTLSYRRMGKEVEISIDGENPVSGELYFLMSIQKNKSLRIELRVWFSILKDLSLICCCLVSNSKSQPKLFCFSFPPLRRGSRQ